MHVVNGVRYRLENVITHQKEKLKKFTEKTVSHLSKVTNYTNMIEYRAKFSNKISSVTLN